MPLAPHTRLGRYEILSPLGAGGMGEVYLARDTTELERLAAVKVLPAKLAADPERMRRFVQEAKTASSLNHPNILTVYEIGEADSIKSSPRVRKGGPAPEDDALALTFASLGRGPSKSPRVGVAT